MKSEMTRKERVLAALHHQEVDRVPTDYWGVPEITNTLMRYLDAKEYPDIQIIGAAYIQDAIKAL